ncbi:unnamed protein product, partial [Toxocara canis]|uniref:Spore protein n=1 Tax=Toxocara canis TaxID=6265 RepID=A0A183U7L5_TOXCA
RKSKKGHHKTTEKKEVSEKSTVQSQVSQTGSDLLSPKNRAERSARNTKQNPF